MALEAVVHRVDVDMAQGREPSVAAEVAVDGIDEYLDVFVAASRAAADAPAGPSMRFECTDRSDLWWLDLSSRGRRTVTTERREASVRIRGTAEQLLLLVWGRSSATAANDVDVTGAVDEWHRWNEFVPPM